MGLKEKMIKRIREVTGDPNADLWTLQFDPEDINKTKNQISPQYINGIPIRTHKEVKQEAQNLIKGNYSFPYNCGTTI